MKDRRQKRWKREHHGPRVAATNRDRFFIDGGGALAILRPLDPARKLAGLDKIELGTPHDIAKPMMDALLNEQPHQFVGYVAANHIDILDCCGNPVGRVAPGDSVCGCGGTSPLAPPLCMRQ